MSREDKMTDSRFVPAAELDAPRTVGDLLAALDVEGASRTEQRAAVERWLVGNTPTRLMRAGLERLGLIDP